MKKTIFLLVGILLIVGLLFACDPLIPQGLMGTGVTNLTNLELAGTLDVAGNTDLVGTLQYGANNLSLVGHSASTEQMVFGSSSITGTITAPHGLTTVTYALCTIGEDPGAGAVDHLANCSVSISSNVVTVKVWENDMVTESTETDVDVFWLAIGTP